MIYTRLAGGLGNQLFQYAAARALAIRLGAEVVLDPRHYDHDQSRQILLDRFRIAATEAVLPGGSILGQIAWRILGRGPRWFAEKTLAYDPRINDLTAPAYLSGYWQSERYFRDYSRQIRADLQLRAAPRPEAQEMLARITAARPAVSLHVRRGDYVSGEALGTCGPGYYRRAAERLANQLGQAPTLFAFSDDPDWVRREMPLPFETVVVDLNGPDRPEEDLRLMSACDHHIIANSTFSWWGAWLNPSPEKLVIAPKKWFPQPGTENPDILPPEWEQIDGGV